MTTARASSGWRARRRRLRLLLVVRARAGVRRARRSFVPVFSAAVAAMGAYWISSEVVGNDMPVFAPIAAWVCLGFSQDRQLRKVAELGAGVTLGVVFGEVFLALFGTGAVQIGAVLLIAALTARLLDRGQLFTMQAGVQGLVIVGVPFLALDGGFGRWVDALVGAALALIVAALTPGDVRRRPRALAQATLGETADMLRTVASALREGSPERADDALTQGRGAQPVLEEWSSALHTARETVRISPARRREAGAVAELGRAWTLADRAMRNARVITRRAHAAASEGPVPDIAGLVDAVASALADLASALGQGVAATGARDQLITVAEELRPERFTDRGWRVLTLVPLLRSLVVDALQLTGLSASEAHQHLPTD